jgi:prevent-host-death family protein
MSEIGASDGDNSFGRLLDLVEAGEEIVITRHGRPVARLAPHTVISPARVEAARAAAARIRQRAEARGAGPFNWEEWKSYRDEGRK